MRPTALNAASPLYYIEAGDGEPVVLLHGLGADNRTWDSFRDRLAATHRLFTPDLPGHGGSAMIRGRFDLAFYVDYVARWLDALSIGPVSVAGHSLGGAIALALAVDRPDLVRSVAAICPIRLSDQRPAGPILRRFVAFGLARAFGQPSIGATQRFLTEGLGVTPSAITPALLALWQETAQASTRAMLRTNRKLRRSESNLAGRLHQIACPVGLLWGSQDPFFPGRAAASAIASRFPRAVGTVTETGHLPMVERPEEFMEWLEQHLERTTDRVPTWS